MKVKDKIFPAIAVTAFLVLTLFIFAPSQILLSNPNEFNASFFELLGYLFIIALPVFLLISILLTFLLKNECIRQRIIALLLSLAFLFWLQGNILLWNYGQLTGSQIHFNIYYLIADAAIWLAIITIILIKYKFFYKYAVLISCAFIVIQAISTSILVYNQPEVSASKNYEIDRANEFTFSNEKNVIILVLDTFQSDIFQEIVTEDESYKDIFQGFTYFPDAVSGYPSTYASIPNILTGQYYDNSVPFSTYLEQSYYSPTSIPKVLKDHEFEVDCFTNLDSIYLDERVISNSKKANGIRKSTIINIYDATIFRYSPDFLKRYIYNDGAWLLKTYIPERQVISNNNSVNSVKTSQMIFNDKALTLSDMAFANRVMTEINTVEERCVFKFYRLNGSHPPYLLNEKLEYEKMNDDNGYSRQSKASLRITKIFLDELKRLGVFDNSMIFVIGDHGLISGGEHIQENANPLFLVKTFYSKEQMVTSYMPVSSSDINNTIFSELGLIDNLTGPSIFDTDNYESHERRFLYYNWANDDVWKDYLPTIKEYFISGPVWEEKSWRSTGNVFVSEFAEKPLTEWLDGFSSSEGTQENNWRWCSAEGTIVINNTSNSDRKYIISAMLYTGYPDESDLTIESTLLNDTVKINNSGYSYTKEIIVQPGSHGIIFRCNAKRIEAINDLRFLVFNMTNFQIQEVK